MNSQPGKFFQTTVGVRQGCLFSPILFNWVLAEIIQETLHDPHTSIFIGGRPICNLRFADGIELVGGSNGELQEFTKRLVNRETAYGIEVSTEKNRIMANNANNTKADN